MSVPTLLLVTCRSSSSEAYSFDDAEFGYECDQASSDE